MFDEESISTNEERLLIQLPEPIRKTIEAPGMEEEKSLWLNVLGNVEGLKRKPLLSDPDELGFRRNLTISRDSLGELNARMADLWDTLTPSRRFQAELRGINEALREPVKATSGYLKGENTSDEAAAALDQILGLYYSKRQLISEIQTPSVAVISEEPKTVESEVPVEAEKSLSELTEKELKSLESESLTRLNESREAFMGDKSNDNAEKLRGSVNEYLDIQRERARRLDLTFDTARAARQASEIYRQYQEMQTALSATAKRISETTDPKEILVKLKIYGSLLDSAKQRAKKIQEALKKPPKEPEKVTKEREIIQADETLYPDKFWEGIDKDKILELGGGEVEASVSDALDQLDLALGGHESAMKMNDEIVGLNNLEDAGVMLTRLVAATKKSEELGALDKNFSELGLEIELLQEQQEKLNRERVLGRVDSEEYHRQLKEYDAKSGELLRKYLLAGREILRKAFSTEKAWPRREEAGELIREIITERPTTETGPEGPEPSERLESEATEKELDIGDIEDNVLKMSPDDERHARENLELLIKFQKTMAHFKWLDLEQRLGWTDEIVDEFIKAAAESKDYIHLRLIRERLLAKKQVMDEVQKARDETGEAPIWYQVHESEAPNDKEGLEKILELLKKFQKEMSAYSWADSDGIFNDEFIERRLRMVSEYLGEGSLNTAKSRLEGARGALKLKYGWLRKENVQRN